MTDDLRTDEELMGQVCLGQANGFEEIVRRYENKLLATVYRQIQNEDIAEDIVQETFIAVWKERNTFNKNIAKFSTWIYNILSNQIGKYLRDNRKSREMISLSAVEEDKDSLTIGCGQEAWFEALSEKRLVKLKGIVLQYLTKKEQIFYHLKEEQGLSCEAISHIAPFEGVKVATLQKQRQRYMEKIVEVLKKEKIL